MIHGFKNKISEDEAYTGKELCDLLAINFKDIIDKRKEYQRANLLFLSHH